MGGFPCGKGWPHASQVCCDRDRQCRVPQNLFPATNIQSIIYFSFLVIAAKSFRFFLENQGCFRWSRLFQSKISPKQFRKKISWIMLRVLHCISTIRAMFQQTHPKALPEYSQKFKKKFNVGNSPESFLASILSWKIPVVDLSIHLERHRIAYPGLLKTRSSIVFLFPQ